MNISKLWSSITDAFVEAPLRFIVYRVIPFVGALILVASFLAAGCSVESLRSNIGLCNSYLTYLDEKTLSAKLLFLMGLVCFVYSLGQKAYSFLMFKSKELGKSLSQKLISQIFTKKHETEKHIRNETNVDIEAVAKSDNVKSQINKTDRESFFSKLSQVISNTFDWVLTALPWVVSAYFLYGAYDFYQRDNKHDPIKQIVVKIENIFQSLTGYNENNSPPKIISTASAFTTPIGKQWIQIASGKELQKTIRFAKKYSGSIKEISVLSTTSGWYVVSIGPIPKSEIGDKIATLVALGKIPKDSIPSGGKSYTSIKWSANVAKPHCADNSQSC